MAKVGGSRGSGYANASLRAWVKKDFLQFALAKNSPQFSESHERNEQDEHEQCEYKNSPPRAIAEMSNTLVERLHRVTVSSQAVIKADLATRFRQESSSSRR